MKTPRTDYEKIAATKSGRRLLRQEDLIFDTTEALAIALQDSGMNKTQLADKLGRSKAFITQLLGGGRNLTLRTIADVCYALNCRPEIRFVPLTERRIHAELFVSSAQPQPGTPRDAVAYSFSYLNQDAVRIACFPLQDAEPATSERGIAA